MINLAVVYSYNILINQYHYLVSIRLNQPVNIQPFFFLTSEIAVTYGSTQPYSLNSGSVKTRKKVASCIFSLERGYIIWYSLQKDLVMFLIHILWWKLELKTWENENSLKKVIFNHKFSEKLFLPGYSKLIKILAVV